MNRELYHIQQKNSWSCLAACAAMLTGTKMADFEEWCGHDGSEHDPTSSHPEKRRGFFFHEFAGYLAKHKMHCGLCWSSEVGKWDDCFHEGNLSLLSVASRTLPPPNQHVVIWTGEVVLDPREDKPTRLDEYDIKEWWPIIDWRG